MLLLYQIASEFKEDLMRIFLCLLSLIISGFSNLAEANYCLNYPEKELLAVSSSSPDVI